MYGIPSPDEQVSTHFLRALADIRAGIRRKIECALCAHPPNLPTFRVAGLGLGPPRSDPGICDAGLEDWAATGRGVGPLVKYKG